MDDELPGGVWRIAPDIREGLRLERIRGALEEGAWEVAVLEAEELLDEEPRHPEALFLLGEALLELADFELARLCYEQRVRLDGGDLPSLLGLAIAAFQGCDLLIATETAREVVRRQPDNAEAHYYLGLALERLPGRTGEALTELTAAARLEPDRFPLPMQLADGDWQQLVGAAVVRLHPRLQVFFAQIQFHLEDLPTVDELQDHDPPLPPTIGAMYVGRPPDASDPWQQRPQAIRLFARNLGRAPTTEELVAQLSHALQEEALDWLGLSLEEL
ncbi:MAG TPA: tetratricopeptide repeat protein [Deltaproteobacteria bacterium]|nr:tetratricopeptide repeat protein [Deltaproteobacteria bacterium]